jgi:hypothetical protein
MIEKFNFNLNYNEYIVIQNDFVTEFYDYKEKKTIKGVTIPKNTILKVDNISMGGYQYKTGLYIVFVHTKKINKHVKEKLPSKFKVMACELNGMEYIIYESLEAVEKKINGLKRKSKIENLLSEEV